jgi:hypothetical protein
MPNKRALPEQAASFIETMDCLPVSKLPDGPEWTYEIKLYGYRLEVVRKSRVTTLYSRRENVLNQRFPYIAKALQDLPNDTVVDGELVALSPDGRPDFHLLQNFRSAESRIVYYAFDILVHEGRRLTGLPLFERRAILSNVVEPGEHVALSQVSDRPARLELEHATWEMSKTTQSASQAIVYTLPMAEPIQILTVERDGEDGLIVTFSDGTIGGYVAEELLELRPFREPAAAFTQSAASVPASRAGSK